MMNPYEVLGVTSSSSEDEISAAYRRLAQQFHPDQHHEASPPERARWTEAMATINEAYNTLKDSARKAAYDRDQVEPTEPDSRPSARQAPHQRPPRSDECMLCGHMPAHAMSFQHQRAFIFRANIYGTSGTFCRDCGQGLGRSHQNRTLWTGWWGLLSFFRNFWVVWKNSLNLRIAAGLSMPTISPHVAAVFHTPISPGKPVMRRSGVWVSAALALVLIASASNSEDTGSTYYAPPSNAATWSVGNCVSGYSSLVPVDCSSSHSGMIVSVGSSSSDCGYDAETYVDDFPDTYCIDEDR